MLELHKEETESFGYRFSEAAAAPSVQLMAVGRETRTSTSYKWNGNNRKDINCGLFQYTLSGRGRIRLGEQEHDLTSGRGFLVQLPSDHCYYLPGDSSHWEFVFVMINGKKWRQHWQRLQSRWGMMVSAETDSDLLKRLLDAHKEASAHQIRDVYQASMLAYTIVMEMYRAAEGLSEHKAAKWPAEVHHAVRFIELNYMKPIGLDDIADFAGLSKYHFARLFHQAVGLSPASYLIRHRVETAVRLLARTTKPIREIARETGFANGNYFCKVFRKYTGASPGEFRRSKELSMFDFYTLR